MVAEALQELIANGGLVSNDQISSHFQSGRGAKDQSETGAERCIVKREKPFLAGGLANDYWGRR